MPGSVSCWLYLLLDVLENFPSSKSHTWKMDNFSLLQLSNSNFESAVNISNEFDWLTRHYTCLLK